MSIDAATTSAESSSRLVAGRLRVVSFKNGDSVESVTFTKRYFVQVCDYAYDDVGVDYFNGIVGQVLTTDRIRATKQDILGELLQLLQMRDAELCSHLRERLLHRIALIECNTRALPAIVDTFKRKALKLFLTDICIELIKLMWYTRFIAVLLRFRACLVDVDLLDTLEDDLRRIVNDCLKRHTYNISMRASKRFATSKVDKMMAMLAEVSRVANNRPTWDFMFDITDQLICIRPSIVYGKEADLFHAALNELSSSKYIPYKPLVGVYGTKRH
jgi:hypothetical protein